MEKGKCKTAFAVGVSFWFLYSSVRAYLCAFDVLVSSFLFYFLPVCLHAMLHTSLGFLTIPVRLCSKTNKTAPISTYFTQFFIFVSLVPCSSFIRTYDWGLFCFTFVARIYGAATFSLLLAKISATAS